MFPTQLGRFLYKIDQWIFVAHLLNYIQTIAPRVKDWKEGSNTRTNLILFFEFFFSLSFFLSLLCIYRGHFCVCVCRPAAQWRQLGLQGGGRGCAVGRRPVRGEDEAEGEGENVYGHRANLISTGGDSS